MDASGFWKEFKDNGLDWHRDFNRGHAHEVFHAIEHLLDKHGIFFCFEITADDTTCSLIFSPEGDSQIAAQVDALVAAGDQVEGWKVFGRRQRKPLADAAAILTELYSIDVDQCRFDFNSDRDQPTVEIFIPRDLDLTCDQEQGFADTFVWHALGEDLAMARAIRPVVRRGIPDGKQTLTAAGLVQCVLLKFGNSDPAQSSQKE